MAARLTPDQLRKEPTFIALPEKYRALVIEYVKAVAAGEVNPKTVAILKVYTPTSKQSARVMSYAYFAKPAIAEVVALADGLTPREAFIAEVKRLSLRRASPTQLAALKLYGEMMGFCEPAKSVKTPADKSKDASGGVAVSENAPKVKVKTDFERYAANIRF